MKNELFVSASEVANDLGVSKPFAYKAQSGKRKKERLKKQRYSLPTWNRAGQPL